MKIGNEDRLMLLSWAQIRDVLLECHAHQGGLSRWASLTSHFLEAIGIQRFNGFSKTFVMLCVCTNPPHWSFNPLTHGCTGFGTAATGFSESVPVFNSFSRGNAMISDSNRLVQCFNTMSAFGKEINALCTTLNERLTKEVEKANLPCKVAGGFSEDSRTDESTWVYTDIAHSLPLMSQSFRKSRPEMYLNYQISMTGEGMFFDGNDEPLLHVSLWSDPTCFKDNDASYMCYPLDPDSPYQLIENRLIVWGDIEGGWKEHEWSFSIRLLTLDSSQALLDCVINPAIALLRVTPGTLRTDALVALPDTLVGLVKYADKSVLR